MMLWIELALFLGCIVIAARIGGIGLGVIAGIGLVIFVFLFHLPPGSPPGTVLGMIIAVITALSVMQAAGGLDGAEPGQGACAAATGADEDQ